MNRAVLGLCAALLCLGAVAAVFSVQRAARQIEIALVCDAAVAQDWQATLELSEKLVGPDPDGRYAAECRCWALIATEQGSECTSLLERLLADERAADWVPESALANQLIRERRDRGDLLGAAELSARAVRAYPEDLNLLRLDIALRSASEGEESVLREIESRLGSDESSLRRAVVLAASYRRRGDAAAALRVLGEQVPKSGSELVSPWFEQRGAALADSGDLEGLRENYVSWQRLGGDPAELRARYALSLSRSQLGVGGVPMIELLRASLRERESLADRELLRSLYERLIAHLMADGRQSDALAVYDAAIAEVELPAVSREQIVREKNFDAVASSSAEISAGEIVFHFPPEANGGTLRISPPAEESPDGAYQVLAVEDDRAIRVQRQLSKWPLRWVVQDRSGSVRASGAVWPSTTQSVRVDVVGRAARERDPSTVALLPDVQARPPADAVRRVFTVLLDCADWRLFTYLRERRELPFLGYMLENGHHAVLDSSPPLTAAAMETLVWPERSERVSFLGLLHQLGLEVAGLASVGRNPLSFLSELLPKTPTLFDVIGSGPHVAANMLFAHGAIEAGRHAALAGPNGRQRLAKQAETFRVLSPDERQRFPRFAADARLRGRVEGIASEFDVAKEMAEAGEVDLLLLRIESLDVLTHALYVELTHGAQDDGDAALLDVYRYIDRRLAELYATLDRDDVLIVMSDHGIATSMEHDRNALFLALGAGVPQGRAAGTPALAGVPRVLAELLGVQTAWADTGVAPWATAADGPRIAAIGGTP